MSKKGFKNIDFQLGSVWGTPTAGGRGISVKKAVNARRAGVTMDHHLTPMAQELAAELAADQKKLMDTRPPAAQRFNLVGNTSHMTTEKFYDFLILDNQRRKLLELGLETIHISDEDGLEVTVNIVPELQQEDRHLRKCAPRDILKSGIVASVGTNQRMRLEVGSYHMGILTIHSLPHHLKAHAQNTTEAATTHTVSDEAPIKITGDPINLYTKLGSREHFNATLREIVDQDIPYIRLTTYFKEAADKAPVQKVCVGVLFTHMGNRDTEATKAHIEKRSKPQATRIMQFVELVERALSEAQTYPQLLTTVYDQSDVFRIIGRGGIRSTTCFIAHPEAALLDEPHFKAP